VLNFLPFPLTQIYYHKKTLLLRKNKFIAEEFLETHLQQLFVRIQTSIIKNGIENAKLKSKLDLLKAYCIFVIKKHHK
jgi:hypothetical protein